MRIARLSRQIPFTCCALAITLILGACADQQPTAPQHPRLRLGENSGPVTVSSVTTLFDKNGQPRTTFTQVQKLRPVVRNGIVYSMVLTDSSAQAAGVPTTTVTPILAVQTGDMVGNYNQTVTDTTTMRNYRVVATGPMIYNAPIDYGYFATTSGVKLAEIHYKWQTVSGGYALLAQKKLTYSPTGVLFASVVSTVTSPATYAMSESGPTVSRRLGSFLHGAMCYFLPQTAYAQGKKKGTGTGPIVQPDNMPLPGSDCWTEGAEMGIAGAVVGWDAYNPEIGLFTFYGDLGLFEVNFVSYLRCLRRPPRCTPSTCTGGGGTSW
jgi:hypothetical protein